MTIESQSLRYDARCSGAPGSVTSLKGPFSTRSAYGQLALLLALALPVASGCSIKRFALTKVADALAGSGGDVYASDEDPELVRDATPFALKSIESLLAQLPEHSGLLLSACSGFTQYSYAFVATDADLVEASDYRESVRLRERALRLYLRARNYGLRGLELEHPGITERLMLEPEAAVADLTEPEIDLIYWTGAAWGSAISLGKDRPDLVADVPAVVALMKRGLELDEGHGDGAIHEVMVTLESLPAYMGGSLERAQQHYERAIELSGGQRASAYVTLAESVAVANQDARSFERLLEQALDVDVDAVPAVRLQNIIVQRRARWLLGRTDELFLEMDQEEELP